MPDIFDPVAWTVARRLGGGNSGGSGLPSGSKPNQYLVTDGEGNAKWEDKLGYIAVGDTVLSETTPVFNEDMEGYVITEQFALTVGDFYKVTYNGEDYICKVQSMYDPEMGSIIVLGNGKGFGVSTSTEPFCVAQMGGMTGVIPMDGAENVTIAIARCVVKKIDEVLIPEYKPDYFNLDKVFNTAALFRYHVELFDSNNLYPTKLRDSAVMVDVDTFREYAKYLNQNNIYLAIARNFCVTGFGAWAEDSGGPFMQASLFYPNFIYHEGDSSPHMYLDFYHLNIKVEDGEVVAYAGRYTTDTLEAEATVPQ